MVFADFHVFAICSAYGAFWLWFFTLRGAAKIAGSKSAVWSWVFFATAVEMAVWFVVAVLASGVFWALLSGVLTLNAWFSG